MKKILNKIFDYERRGAKLSLEILGGLVTFIALIYILPLNADILGNMGMDTKGVFVATAIVSAIATLIMGLYGNFPVVLSAGMGVNAYLAFTVYTSTGSWQSALIVMFIAGLLFFILSLTPLRRMIVKAIPNDLKYIISAALGAFIAFVGLKNSGIITGSGSTLVTLGSLTSPSVLLALGGVVLVFALLFVKQPMINKLAIPIAMVVVAIIGLLLKYVFKIADQTNLPTFDGSQWGAGGLENVAFKIFNGKDWLTVLKNPSSYAFIFSLLLVNLFDTTATLLAVARSANLMDKEGNIIGEKKAIMADTVGSLICAPIGTSTVTSFAESGIAVEMGSKTGISAVFAGLLFLLSAFIYPVFSIFTSPSVTAMALISVGAMIFVGNFKLINFEDRINGFTGFITVILVLLTYSISDGIGIGLILYSIMMLVSKRGKQVHPLVYGISVIFLAYFVLKAII